MVEVYLFFAIAFATVSFVAFVTFAVQFFTHTEQARYSYETVTPRPVKARRAMVSLILFGASWFWLFALPLLIVYIAYLLYKGTLEDQ